MSYETILYEPDPEEKFVTITLNRPAKLNAINEILAEELDDAVVRASHDPNVNAVILTGAGRAFCAGYDLISEDFALDTEGWRALMAKNCEKFMRIWSASVPIVAALNGYTLAAGLELAMCCDLAIAAEEARLGEPEIRHASGPPSFMMPWLIPIRQARHLMYTGDMIDGVEAARIHLVNRAVPGDRLMYEARRLAAKLARMPTPGIKFTKAALNHQQITAGLQASWAYNMETTSSLHASEPGRSWMKKLREMPLSEFLALREGPFRNLD